MSQGIGKRLNETHFQGKMSFDNKKTPVAHSFKKRNPLKINLKNLDNRPYLTVSILGVEVVGLLDSGASRTVLGEGCEQFIRKLGLVLTPVKDSVRTACGQLFPIIGSVDIPYTVDNKTVVIPTLAVPAIKSNLVLGCDFWKEFNIRPEVWVEMIHTDQIMSEVEHELTDSQKEDLLTVVAKFPAAVDGYLGKTHLIEHNIDTGDAYPIKQKHYIWSPFIQAKVMVEIDRMLKLGVIQASNSPWNNPLVHAPKPDGSLRICLDSRKLNQVSRKDSYPLQHINRILGRFKSTKFLSKIDLKDAFWQIPLNAESQPKTAFTVPGYGLWEFTRLPFGLHNSAQSLCRLMDKILGVDLEPHVFVYLDDIIISSDTFDEHCKLLGQVAERLGKAGLTINLKKSKFLQKSITYLGYVINENGLHTNPDKIRPILNYSVPKTPKEVRRFLGMAGWYRRFIPDFANLSVPLSDLLQKGKKFRWSDEANEAFLKLKSALISAPVLVNPDFTKPFAIQTDASETAIAGVLVQDWEEKGEERVIAYFGRKLTSPEKKYATTEKEALAVIESVNKFRGYIEGTHVTIITDHASLMWLQNLKNPTGRLARWAVKMQQVDMTIKHRPGRLHLVPDALSRAIDEICSVTVISDPWYETLMKNVTEKPDIFPLFKIVNDVLYKYCSTKTDIGDQVFNWKRVVPLQLRKDILLNAHNVPSAGHLGIYKTAQRIKAQFYWPGMGKEIREYVLSCDLCKNIKDTTHAKRTPMGSPKVASRPWEIISVDFVGDFPRSKKGNKAILTVSDWFSKYILAFPMKSQNAKAIVTFLEESVFSVFGVPATIITDNGSQFKSGVFRNLLYEYKISQRLNPRYHSQVNPVERVHKVLIASVRAYLLQDQSYWDVHLQKIASALRTAKHESTKFTPHFINFGREMIRVGSDHQLESDLRQAINENEPSIEEQMTDKQELLTKIDKIVKDNIATAYDRYSHYYNLRARSRSYKVGDIVRRKNFTLSSAAKNINAKLLHRQIECKVSKVLGSNTYELENMDGKILGVYSAHDII